MAQAVESARITVKFDDLDDLVSALHRKVPRAVAVGLRQGILVMIRDVVKNRLRGQYLKRRTGTLIRSITASPPKKPIVHEGTEDSWVVDWFGTHLKYGAAHEHGFRGGVTVPGHAVKAHKRKGYTTKKGVKVRGHSVRAGTRGTHRRRVNMRARYYLRDTMDANRGRVRLRIARALLQLVRTGKIPSGKSVKMGFGG